MPPINEANRQVSADSCPGRSFRRPAVLGLGGPPAQQFLPRRLRLERAAIQPELTQVRVGATDQRALRDAENLHDLVAVQVRTDRVQLLLLPQAADPLLQVRV